MGDRLGIPGAVSFFFFFPVLFHFGRLDLPGSPRGPGEPCHPTGVPAQKPAKPTTRLSIRARVPTLKHPPLPGIFTHSHGRTEARGHGDIESNFGRHHFCRFTFNFVNILTRPAPPYFRCELSNRAIPESLRTPECVENGYLQACRSAIFVTLITKTCQRFSKCVVRYRRGALLAPTRRGLVRVRPGEIGISQGCGPKSSALRGYRFSAFWLRSSVVSVLISLISDTSPIWGLHIKRIFGPRS